MIRLIPSLPAAYVIARVVWPLAEPLALRLGLAAILLVASQYHLWSRLSSGSVFAPEFPRPVVILFNWAFGAIALAAVMQLALDLIALTSLALPGGGWALVRLEQAAQVGGPAERGRRAGVGRDGLRRGGTDLAQAGQVGGGGALGRRREAGVEFGGAPRPAGTVVEQRPVGAGRLRQVEGGGALREGAGRRDQGGRALRAQHVRRVEIARGRLAAEGTGEGVGVLLGQGTGQRRGDLGIAAQVEDRLPLPRVRDRVGAVRLPGDGVGLGLEAEPRPGILHHAEPGLLDELEQAGRRGGPGLGGGIEGGFAPRRGEEIVEADAARRRPVADGLDHRSGGGRAGQRPRLGRRAFRWARRRGEQEHPGGHGAGDRPNLRALW
ncbi:hypothetical protein [Methylobacterium oryzae]|uniref:hypothetical protein n=1 Tax=Methylobacterium oryzae TaxID=334852 RepID=UPI002F351B9E